MLAERIACFPGGNALNAAVALQRLGVPVSFVGAVGDDPFGDLLLSQLERIGLSLRSVRRERGRTTPATLVYREDGEDRRFIHALGDAGLLTGTDVPLELVPEGGVVLVGGYLKSAEWSDGVLLDILRHAESRGSSTVLNVCIPRQGKVESNRCLRLLRHVDVFLPNEDEARALTGETDAAAQARVFREAGADLAIITRGAQGLYADDGRQAIRMGAYSVPVVDPSGCGDCFAGGIAAALLRKWETVRLLAFASAVGAFSATALGCTSGVPRLEEVERFVEANSLDISTRPAAGDG